MVIRNRIDLEFGPEIMDTLEKVIQSYKEIRTRESVQYIINCIPKFHPYTILISDRDIYEDIASQENDYIEMDLEKQVNKSDLIYFRLPIKKEQFEIQELEEIFPKSKVKDDTLLLNGLKIAFLNKKNLIELMWRPPDSDNYDTYLNITLNILDKVFVYCKQKQYLRQDI